METIFVAYGEPGHRNTVLEFATEQAAASKYDLLVYHVYENEEESVQQVREEIETIIERIAPGLSFEIEINTRNGTSDLTNVSKQKRLTDAILESDRDYEYIVMGDIERDSLEEFTHASMTKAVLEMHAVPVMLVPV